VVCCIYSIDSESEHFFLNGPWRPTDPDKKGKKIKKEKRMHLVPNKVPRPQQLVKWSFTFSQGDGFVSPTQYIYVYILHAAKSVTQPPTPRAVSTTAAPLHLYIIITITSNGDCSDTHF